jgi:hypothetical protein
VGVAAGRSCSMMFPWVDQVGWQAGSATGWAPSCRTALASICRHMVKDQFGAITMGRRRRPPGGQMMWRPGERADTGDERLAAACGVTPGQSCRPHRGGCCCGRALSAACICAAWALARQRGQVDGCRGRRAQRVGGPDVASSSGPRGGADIPMWLNVQICAA